MLTVGKVDLSAMIEPGKRSSCTNDSIVYLPGLGTVHKLKECQNSRQSYAIDLCLVECESDFCSTSVKKEIRLMQYDFLLCRKTITTLPSQGPGAQEINTR
jgi:hypothetical protein